MKPSNRPPTQVSRLATRVWLLSDILLLSADSIAEVLKLDVELVSTAIHANHSILGELRGVRANEMIRDAAMFAESLSRSIQEGESFDLWIRRARRALAAAARKGRVSVADLDAITPTHNDLIRIEALRDLIDRVMSS